MNKVVSFLKNKWFILFISILNGAYPLCLCVFAWCLMFYKITFVNTVKFAIVYSVFSVIIALFMFYTRKSLLTTVFNLINMVVFLPCLLLGWGNWAMIIPAAIVTLFGFFTCVMGDTARTVFGTIFLLLYIVFCIGFFLVMNVFRVTTTDTLIEQGVSPSGNFRYYIMNIENKSSGKTALYVEPNTIDKNFYDMIELKTTIKKLVKQANNPTVMNCRWDGDIMYINDEEYFDEKDFVTVENGVPEYNFEGDNWTHTYFEANYPIFEAIHKFVTVVKDKLEELKSGDDAQKLIII